MWNTMTISNLQEPLQRFFERLEAIQAKTNLKLEDAAKVTAGLDKLTEIVVSLELQRNQENKLLSKLETVSDQLEKLACGGNAGVKTPKKGFTPSFRAVVAGTKTLGQVMEIIADSVQTMMDSVLQAINEFRMSSSS
jgi:hypothetical protein